MAKAQIDTSVIVIVVDGTKYELRPGALTGKIVRKVRETTGRSLQSAMNDLAEDPDLDSLAIVCYAAALQSRGKADFDKIESSISYSSDITIEQKEDEEQGEA